MKPKCFYTILLFLFSFYCFSQEPFIYLNTQLGNKIIKPESVIPIVDKLSGNIAVVVKHKKNAFVNLYNKNRELITELKIDKFPEGVSNLIGSCSNNFQFTLFYSNNENSKYGSLNIDFENKTINTEIDLNLNLKKEYLIGSFEEDAQVYLLSVLKDSSILKLYTLDINNNLEIKTIDLSQESFKKHNNLKTTLYHLITSNQNPSRLQSSTIKYNTPNSLELTSAVNKIYFQDGIISITNDNISSHTDLIQIKTEDGSFICNHLEKKGFLKEELRSESNSFLFRNYYMSSYATTSKLVFAIYDLEKKEFLKEYTITDDDSISFKNSPIIMSRGTYVKTKEANNSNQFLRNLVNSNIGVFVYEKDNLFIVSLRRK